MDLFRWWLAVSVLVHLAVVIAYDGGAVFKGYPTLSETIRDTWMSLPVGIEMAVVIGGIILRHFMRF